MLLFAEYLVVLSERAQHLLAPHDRTTLRNKDFNIPCITNPQPPTPTKKKKEKKMKWSMKIQHNPESGCMIKSYVLANSLILDSLYLSQSDGWGLNLQTSTNFSDL